MKSLLLSLPVLAFFMPSSCSFDNSENNPPIADTISFYSEALFPEDFIYSETENAFFAGSLRKGKIVKIDIDGKVTTFADSDDLISTVGMALNPVSGELYVCNADAGLSERTLNPEIPRLANIKVYNLETGAETASYDLSILVPEQYPAFVNDIAFDDAGNAYITNSFMPHIYKISSNGEMSLFATTEAWIPTPGAYGLNGIECGNGYIIVGFHETGDLFKVSVSNPTNISKIEVDVDIFSVDGIRFLNNGKLAVVSNVIGPSILLKTTTHLLSSNNNWATATEISKVVEPSNQPSPTTVELVNGKPYLIHSYLQNLFIGNPSVSEYKLVQLKF